MSLFTEDDLIARYSTCTCSERQDDDGRPLVPKLVECGTCGFTWCERCHLAPSARSWCEGWDRHNEAADWYDRLDAARADRQSAGRAYELTKQRVADLPAAERDRAMDEALATLEHAQERLNAARQGLTPEPWGCV